MPSIRAPMIHPDHTSHWYAIPVVISGNTMTFTVTDGGLGDDDPTVNGTVIDQGGPAVATAATIPTLTDAMLLLLGLGMLLSGILAARRKHRDG
jgi:trimeric autotransporter adhesin